jgi:hypothetical protein
VPAALCPSARDATPTKTTVTGVAATHRNVSREQVFRRIQEPASRLVVLWPDASAAFKAFRRQILLPWEFRGNLRIWPIEANLPLGIELGLEQGFESWYAQVCLNGFLNGEPEKVRAVAEILKVSAGITVKSTAERSTLIVSENYFRQHVTIGEPTLIRGQESHSGATR